MCLCVSPCVCVQGELLEMTQCVVQVEPLHLSQTPSTSQLQEAEYILPFNQPPMLVSMTEQKTALNSILSFIMYHKFIIMFIKLIKLYYHKFPAKIPISNTRRPRRGCLPSEFQAVPVPPHAAAGASYDPWINQPWLKTC